MTHPLFFSKRKVEGPTKVINYLSVPDFSRHLLTIPESAKSRIRNLLSFLYDDKQCARMLSEIERLLVVHYAHKTDHSIASDEQFNPQRRFSEKDLILITYGDLIINEFKIPLTTLKDLLAIFVHGKINTVHVLPFFPYSSDKGFAVIDYREVDPNLGTWEDIYELGKHFKLMFDGVFNHISSQSRWFQEFLRGNPYYKDFFTAFSSHEIP